MAWFVIRSMRIPAQTVWKNGAMGSRRLRESLQEGCAPYKSILDAGVPPPGPFFILWSAVTRRSRTGEVQGAAQKLSREQALRAMTVNGAYLSFEEKLKGSIEAGRYADLVVIRDDHLAIPEDRIIDIVTVMTMVGGRIVFGDLQLGVGLADALIDRIWLTLVNTIRQGHRDASRIHASRSKMIAIRARA